MSSSIEIMVEESPQDFANAGAALFAMRAKKYTGEGRPFSVAISGGETPKKMYRRLAQDPYLSQVNWQQVHLFWVDERCVELNDPASNFGAAKRNFLSALPLAETQVHPMPAQVEPEEGARRYEEELKGFFHLKEGHFPVFDLIFLGLGKDGHTASLFPGDPALKERKKLVTSVTGGDPYVSRLTMTCPVLNNSKQVVFLVSGEEKAQVVKSVLGERDENLPAGKINPVSGRLTWILDSDAASLIRPFSAKSSSP